MKTFFPLLLVITVMAFVGCGKVARETSSTSTNVPVLDNTNPPGTNEIINRIPGMVTNNPATTNSANTNTLPPMPEH